MSAQAPSQPPRTERSAGTRIENGACSQCDAGWPGHESGRMDDIGGETANRACESVKPPRLLHGQRKGACSRGAMSLLSLSLSLLGLVVGFVITMVLGERYADRFVKQARQSISLEPPPRASDEQKQQWQELTDGNEGGKYIGRIERFMFFAAFMLSNAALVVGAWLAFKVGSKWNAWTNITAVPKTTDKMDDLDFAIGRRRWASHVLTTFLVGTGFNVCAAMVGAAVALKFEECVKTLGAAVAGNFGQLLRLVGC